MTYNVFGGTLSLTQSINHALNCVVQKQFHTALQYVGAEFLDRVNYYNNVWWPARTLIEQAHTDRFQVSLTLFTYLLFSLRFISCILSLSQVFTASELLVCRQKDKLVC